MFRYCWRTLWFVPFIWKLWKLLTYTYENAHREKITQSLRQCSVSLSLPLFQFFVVIVVGDADDSMGLEWEMLWISKSGTAFFCRCVSVNKGFLVVTTIENQYEFWNMYSVELLASKIHFRLTRVHHVPNPWIFSSFCVQMALRLNGC